MENKHMTWVRLVLVVAFVAGGAYAQTCIVPAPARPPTPGQIVVNLPSDGGTMGCTGVATVSGAIRPASEQSVSRNADCAVFVRVAKQMASIDNGWNDGGAP